MSWGFKKRKGYSYEDAIAVTSSTDEEYKIIKETPCERCKNKRYEKKQGADKHGRFVQGKFFDVLHCECQQCGHKRDFVFDTNELPSFKKLAPLAAMLGEEEFEKLAGEVSSLGQNGLKGKCPQCGTPFELRIGQAAMGVPCKGCGVTLQLRPPQ